MCTVTFIPKENNQFVFMSSRDEAISRGTLEPKIYTINEVKCMFPKDIVAGGTWIGASENNRLVCLLNGGFVKHKRQPTYRHSRGKIVKDVLIALDCYSAMIEYDLNAIEPFTLVVLDWQHDLKAYELVWDGNKKHLVELKNEPRIWSSSTLYTDDMKSYREKWFSEFLKSNTVFSLKSSFKFHRFTASDNLDFGLQINRGLLKTVSITGVEKSNSKLEMVYFDALKKTYSNKTLSVNVLNYE